MCSADACFHVLACHVPEGAEAFYNAEQVALWLQDKLQLETVYLKYK